MKVTDDNFVVKDKCEGRVNDDKENFARIYEFLFGAEYQMRIFGNLNIRKLRWQIDIFRYMSSIF